MADATHSVTSSATNPKNNGHLHRENGLADEADANFPPYSNSGEALDSYEAEERRAIQEESGSSSFFSSDAGLESVIEPGIPVDVEVTQAAPAFEYVTTAIRLETLLPELLTSPVIGLDTETTGLDPLKDHLRPIQIATPTQTLVIDADSCPIPLLTPLFSAARRMVGHNLKFDLQFLLTAGLPWPTGKLFDTMLATQLLGAGSEGGKLRNCGLAAVVERFLARTLDKTEQAKRWAGPLRHEQLVYAAKDAAILLPLAEQLQAALDAATLQQAADIEHRCLPALAWMELTGMPIDEAAWLARAAEETHRAQALEAQMYALLGREYPNGKVLHLSNEPTVNWNSPEQVMEVFRMRGHALDNTNSQSLTTLLGTEPLAEALLEYREAKKRAGTYGKSWLTQHLHPITHRIHADYFQLGAASGRMSCTKPNMQNLPRNGAYRRAVCPGEGRAIVKADFSQIELRIAAVMANEQNMLAAFRAGDDLHKLTAAKVLNLPLDRVEKEHRQLAKALNFGLLYGMGARALQAYAATNYKVSLTEAQATAHRQRFFQTYPGLARWHAQTGAYLNEVTEMETRTLANRVRRSVTSFTVAVNSPVQGTGADGLKLALARLFEHRSEVPEARLIACVHDEIVAECPEEEAEQTAAWLKEHMTAAMTELIGDVVPVEVETTIGSDWVGTALKTQEAA
jgi:DNA polymerase I